MSETETVRPIDYLQKLQKWIAAMQEEKYGLGDTLATYAEAWGAERKHWQAIA